MRELCNRFFLAITLCTGEQSVKPRLAQAWIEQLDAVDPSSLPSSVRDDFQLLRDTMYAESPLPEEHAAHASVRKMSARQAADCMELIVVMFRNLTAIDTMANHARRSTAAGSDQGMAFELVENQLLN